MARKKREQMMMGNNAGAPAILPIFQDNLTTTLVPQRAAGSSTPTFTRATTAYVTDFEGLLKPVLSGEARFTGARRVRNVVVSNSDGLTGGAWAKYTDASCTLTLTANAGTDPLGGSTASRIQADVSAGAASALSFQYNNNLSTWTSGRLARNSLYIKSNTGANQIVMLRNDYGGNVVVTVTPTWQRVTQSAAFAIPDTYNQIAVGLLKGTTDSTCDILVWGAQCEDVTGQSNQNPSEYVSVGSLSAPYHGAGVDSVKYFDYENPNTVTNNVVTDHSDD